MWKKRIGELSIYLVATIGIVLGILGIVTAFEKWGVHVTGSREMWIGLIGAVLGGAFTLFGVLLTIYKQEDSELENKRLENMPIIGFEACYNGIEADTTVSCLEGQLITSGFNLYIYKEFVTVKIRVVNHKSAFNFCVKECLINGKKVPVGTAFAPANVRIAEGDVCTFAFDCEKCNTNIFVIMRFSYEDIFGNKYYQDLPFIYAETNPNEDATKTTKQILEIRDIKQPILVKEKEVELENIVEKYTDYDRFCK